MEYILLVQSTRGVPPREEIVMAEMQKYSAELAQAGQLRGGAPLHPDAQGARVRVTGSRATVLDGPFTETKELLGGFFLLEARDREQALEIAKRCPAARSAYVELHGVMREVKLANARGTRFMLLFWQSELNNDPDGSKVAEMDRWLEPLKRDGVYVECGGLLDDPKPARVERRGARATVLDGPFTETKEVLGGYMVALLPDRAAAIALAKQCPHATWGTVEVREIMSVPAPS
ncbi:MAG TPA: YciI family protein [Myxococcota bacterium]|nr:YciI family protein [Myxococcota bacterium]